MKLSFKLYRTATLPTADVVSICGTAGGRRRGYTTDRVGRPPDGDPAWGILETEAKLRKEFYPFAPRLRIFWPEAVPVPETESMDFVTSKVIFGMEMLAFDINCENVPFAGLCGCDPMDPTDVARADGALRSELERMGLSCEINDFDWRVAYELTGN